MVLDIKLDFSLHLKSVQNKVSKIIGLLCKLQDILPKTSLITTSKSFIWSHLDYGDIIYDRTYNTSFHQNIESIQYKLYCIEFNSNYIVLQCCINKYGDSKRNFQRKTLSRVRLSISSTKTLV